MYNSLFQKEWWLDAVAPSQWGAVVVNKGNEIAARLPFFIEKRYGFTALTQPPLTPMLGPWLRGTDAKPAKQLSSQKELIWELLEQLPKHDLFSQSLHPSITNWLPFYWKDFEQTTRYTYVMSDLSDPNAIWNGFSEQARRNIRKAQNKVDVKTGMEIERFLDLNEKTFTRQGKILPYSKDLVKRIDTAASSRNAREIFYAEDDAGRVHSAVYILWDEHSAYYMMGGEDPELRNSEAGSLLIWEAIQFSSRQTKRFDFEGSMIQPIERFFRSFGAAQTPYSHVVGASKRMKFFKHMRGMFRSMAGKNGD